MTGGFGFIRGVEMTHPDKGTEMFVYERAVAEDARQRGIGLALTARLAELARSQGCYGMWVGVDTDNAAAHATYRAAGGKKPEPHNLITFVLKPSARPLAETRRVDAFTLTLGRCGP